MNITIMPVHIISGIIYKIEHYENTKDNFIYYKAKKLNSVKDINLPQNILGQIYYKGILNIPKKLNIFKTN